MKIISKYKDYYDYLSGIYGVDEKIILNRTNFDIPIYSGVIRFYICGKYLDGYFDPIENRFYFGEELIAKYPREEKKYSKWYRRFLKNEDTFGTRYVYIPKPEKPKFASTFFVAEPDLTHDKNNINEKHGCAIMCSGNLLNEFIRFPKLIDTGIQKVLAPHDIYMMLSEWLAPKDNIIDNRTNEEKILSAGFDKKISFRNIK